MKKLKVLITGPTASGKTTIATALAQLLWMVGFDVELRDDDQAETMPTVWEHAVRLRELRNYSGHGSVVIETRQLAQDIGVPSRADGADELVKTLQQDAENRIEQWNRELIHEGDSYVVQELRKLDLTDVQIAAVLDVVDGTCRHCFDAPTPCHCWDDE